MKLAELLNVDTTKENWFKLLSKKGINPKTVNAVSKGGGGDGGIKEYYYKILSHTNEQGMSPLQLLSYYGLVPFNTCIRDGKKSNYIVYDNHGDGMEAVHVSQYIVTMDSKLQAFSYLDLEVQSYFIDTNMSIEFHKGNLYDRAEIIAFLGEPSEEEKAQIKELLNTMYLNYFQEITKEEYESLITQ